MERKWKQIGSLILFGIRIPIYGWVMEKNDSPFSSPLLNGEKNAWEQEGMRAKHPSCHCNVYPVKDEKAFAPSDEGGKVIAAAEKIVREYYEKL